MTTLTLPKKTLFLEFFVSSIEFVGKDRAKDFAPGVLHYIGPSKASDVRFYDMKTRSWKSKFNRIMGFHEGKPIMAKGEAQKITIDDTTRWLAAVGAEYYDLNEQKWFRSADQFVHVHAKEKPHNAYRPKILQVPGVMPYGFWIKSIGKNDLVTVEYPRQRTTLEVGKTYAYICYRQQYQLTGMQYTFPNTYVVLWVKNHGKHDTVELVSQKDLDRADPALLTRNNPIIRDFRKHSRKFSF